MDASMLTEFFRAIFRSPQVRRPSVVLVASVVLLILGEYLTGVRWSNSPVVSYAIYWVLLLIACSVFSVIELRDMRRSEERAVVSVVLAGVIIGLCVALGKLYFYRELWTVFNLLAEPMRTALLALVVSWIFALRERATPQHNYSI